jgi:hypothetical protein
MVRIRATTKTKKTLREGFWGKNKDQGNRLPLGEGLLPNLQVTTSASKSQEDRETRSYIDDPLFSD